MSDLGICTKCKGYVVRHCEGILICDQCIADSQKSYLDQAKEIIEGDREQTYGHPSKNLTNIAGMWSIYLSAKLDAEIVVDAEDVSWLMCCMKTCRQAHKRKQDNIVDALGYLALIDRLGEGK